MTVFTFTSLLGAAPALALWLGWIAIGAVLGAAAGVLHGAMLARRVSALTAAARTNLSSASPPAVARVGGTPARWVAVAGLLLAALLVAGPLGLAAALVTHRLGVLWVGSRLLDGGEPSSDDLQPTEARSR